MDFEFGQLRALDAVVTAGTFEAAARALRVTPSAISQRLKALEAAAGQVLLVRARPVRVTPSGEVVLRLARQVAVLATDTARELHGVGGGDDPAGAVLPLAVNADSLASWVLPTLAPLADSIRFQLYREDQDHTEELLRAGTVMAAITSRARPVPGCRSVALGVMRYRPMAAPSFVRRWFPQGVTPSALARAPVVLFDRKDEMQHRYLRLRSVDPHQVPAHQIPASVDFAAAVRLGMGWGMLPDLQSQTDERAGAIVPLDSRHVDVALYWQQWSVRSPALDRVAAAIRTWWSDHDRVGG